MNVWPLALKGATMSEQTTSQRFIESHKAGARNFVAGMKADNPDWSAEFAAGFEKGVMDTIAVTTAAELWRSTGERPDGIPS